LIIARSDGTPTYNFCVVVDDWDMNITHVIRGDDHLNNTPRQINILKALNAPLPQYAHVPMILGHDGERLSKRHGAVSVMQYLEDGYLPEALLNYLARLGWAHGDEEVFGLDQFVEWFDLDSISKSPAKFNPEKLLWLNQQYLKKTDSKRLSELVLPFLETDCCNPETGPQMEEVIDLLKERVNTVEELADAAVYFYRPLTPSPELMAEHLTPEIIPVVRELQEKLGLVEWNKQSINSLMKSVVAEHGLKFPKLAMPLRLLVTGETQTPAVDAVLELIGREETLKRISAHMKSFA
ncbi:MAG: glutamate--tRNA ligase, partial [Sulfuricella sp.]|nr:glutamate--tRNA ligase [Sulfuricella sp.]